MLDGSRPAKDAGLGVPWACGRTSLRPSNTSEQIYFLHDNSWLGEPFTTHTTHAIPGPKSVMFNIQILVNFLAKCTPLPPAHYVLHV